MIAMGYGMASLRVTAGLWCLGEFESFKSVIELGSQDIHSDLQQAASFIEGLTGFKFSEDVAVSPETFYKSMGFETYKCIDADGRNNSLVFDLNKDISKTYGFFEKFDLVTNHGTTEHCFDQLSNFRNIHNLCKAQGIMLHGLPFQGYINHGFYNYHPYFFKNLADANNYEILGMWLHEYPAESVKVYSINLMNELKIGRLTSTAILLFVAFRKLSAEAFNIPFDRAFVDPRSL